MLVCCFVFAGVQAQKITRDYNNVSLSEALRQLNEQSEEYTISFLYNELEDFRITTSVHHKTIKSQPTGNHRGMPTEIRPPIQGHHY